MRKFLAWTIGIFTAVAIYLVLDWLARTLGIVVHGRERITSEGDLEHPTSLFGLCLNTISILLGTLIGRMIWFKNTTAGLTEVGGYSFAAWIFGSASLLILSGLIQLAFSTVRSEYSWIAQLAFEMLGLIGVSWAWRQWWKNMTAGGRTDQPQ